MKMAVILFLAAVAAVAFAHPSYEAYKAHYGKFYSDPAENATRAEIYAQNLVLINEQNRRPNSWTAGINEFTDWTNAEFRAKRTGTKGPTADLFGREEYETFHAPLPASVDWRKKKDVVTPPKNQG